MIGVGKGIQHVFLMLIEYGFFTIIYRSAVSERERYCGSSALTKINYSHIMSCIEYRLELKKW